LDVEVLVVEVKLMMDDDDDVLDVDDEVNHL